jgi:hypothetical protein
VSHVVPAINVWNDKMSQVVTVVKVWHHDQVSQVVPAIKVWYHDQVSHVVPAINVWHDQVSQVVPAIKVWYHEQMLLVVPTFMVWHHDQMPPVVPSTIISWHRLFQCQGLSSTLPGVTGCTSVRVCHQHYQMSQVCTTWHSVPLWSDVTDCISYQGILSWPGWPAVQSIIFRICTENKNQHVIFYCFSLTSILAL